MKDCNIILASSSPRRIEMMRANGINPQIIKPMCDEELPAGITMEDAVMFLSLKKALWVEEQLRTAESEQSARVLRCELKSATANKTLSQQSRVGETVRPPNHNQQVATSSSQEPSRLSGDKPTVIIAADTVVYKNGIINKPVDADDAFDILKMLKNDVHYVATGVSMVVLGQTVRRSFCEVTKVFFKDYSDEELLDYVKTDEPYDKAGGYAIQGTFGKYIHHIDGDLNNVIGFPWDRSLRELAALKKQIESER